MSRTRIPDTVLDAAHARARARTARDWSEADRLKAEIAAAGWKVVDHGTDFALSPATPPDVADDGRMRFGSSASVPSRLADGASGVATVVLVVTDTIGTLGRTFTALEETSPSGTSVVIVGDGVRAPEDGALDEIEARAGRGETPFATEVVRTSERLGPAAALNIGVRRAIGPVVILLDPSVEPTGDLVTPLVRALDDPTVAVAGGWGSVLRDGRRFEDTPPGDVDVVSGSLMAFRRADADERGPLDERSRTDFYTAVMWSLVLRDAGEGGRHRRAVVVPDPAAVRHEPEGRSGLADPTRERDLKRDFYRFLDRFGRRADLVGRPD